MNYSTLSSVLVIVAYCITIQINATENKPNIVIIIADDLGYGDVGCFGNTTLRTPNIDRIAKEGALLRHHLAASSMCSPSRTALLTGRYPIRSGMVPSSQIRINIFVASSGGLPKNETTIASLAKKAGYKTALIGKWHLGVSRETSTDFEHHPINHGFDYFYGLPLTNIKDFGNDGDKIVFGQQPHFYMKLSMYMILAMVVSHCLFKTKYIGSCYSVILVMVPSITILYILLLFCNMKILNSMLMRDFEVVEQPIRLKGLTERLSKEGIEFMESRKKDKIPFFLVLSYTHVHTALEVTEEFRGRTRHGRYGDAVEELDSGIGQVMSSLEELGLADNTMLYFTSDNGGHKEERGINGEIDGGYNGIFKGGKSQGAVEGGIRIPTAVKWPGKIPAGTIVDEPTWQMDMFTTLANAINISIPTDRQIDGKDLLPLLSGQEKITPHEYFVHYCGEDVHAVRYRPRADRKVWKLVYKTPDYLPGQDTCEYICSCQSAITLDPPALYELTSDPGEHHPIQTSMSKEYEEIANKINVALQHHKDSIVPVEKQFSLHNLWWQPHLQICCNFPNCDCTDSKYS